MFDQSQSDQSTLAITSTSTIFPRKQNPYLQSLQSLKKISFISKGSYGKVYKYFNKLKNQFYAVKQMKFKGPTDYGVINEIQRQIDLLYKMQSPYLIKLLDHFEGHKNVYLVTEFVDGSNLCEAVYKPKKQLQTSVICKMIVEICDGLIDLHNAKIVHRDLKLENILIPSNGPIKIIDLGQSNFFGQEINRKSMRGTKAYFCPQVANHEQQDDKVDVWCLGVILYELVCLSAPFHDPIQKQMMENIRRFRYPIPQKIKHDKDLLDLFSKIFTWHVNRISIPEVKNHRWIKKNIDGQNPIKFQQIFKQHQIKQHKQFLLENIEKYKNKLKNLKDDNKKIEKLIEECRNQIGKYAIKKP